MDNAKECELFLTTALKKIRYEAMKADGDPDKVFEQIIDFFIGWYGQDEVEKAGFWRKNVDKGVTLSIIQEDGRVLKTSLDGITDPTELIYLFAFLHEYVQTLTYREDDLGNRPAALLLPVMFRDSDSREMLSSQTDLVEEEINSYRRALLLAFVQVVDEHIPSIRDHHSHGLPEHLDWEAFKASCLAPYETNLFTSYLKGDSACDAQYMQLTWN